MTDKPTFHVVSHHSNDNFTTYSIYANNHPFLRPAPGRVLGRREAYAIARLLNEGPWTA